MTLKQELKKINLDEIGLGKMRKYRMEGLGPKVMKSGSLKFTVTTSSGEKKEMFVGNKNEPYASLAKRLTNEIRPRQQFYLGKNMDGSFLLKPLFPKDVGSSADKIPWDSSNKPKEERLEFGVHNKDGMVDVRKQNKSVKKAEDAISNVVETGKEYESRSQNVIAKERIDKVIGKNAKTDIIIPCPHCSELIIMKTEVKRNKISREKILEKYPDLNDDVQVIEGEWNDIPDK
jgi:hypothetical protein